MAKESLRESQQELHELASSAQAAREQEKSRIARELDDELGQLLIVAGLNYFLVRKLTPP